MINLPFRRTLPSTSSLPSLVRVWLMAPTSSPQGSYGPRHDGGHGHRGVLVDRRDRRTVTHLASATVLPLRWIAAEVTGVLLFDESTDCLLMELEGVQYPLVWPTGTRWQEDPPAVVLEHSEKVEPGMTVYGGGGYLHRDHVEELSGSAVAEAPGRCAGPTGEIAFFNIESEVDVITD